jgi:hypothetical protein
MDEHFTAKKCGELVAKTFKSFLNCVTVDEGGSCSPQPFGCHVAIGSFSVVWYPVEQVLRVLFEIIRNFLVALAC